MTPRIDLEKTHPLPFPLAIWIEPTNICNFKCGFCPESLPGYAEQSGYYQHMPMELWAKIVRDLHGLGRPKVIRFFHEGEPLLNKNLPAMIQAAQGTLTDRTEVFTNGSLLQLRASQLVAAGLSLIRVSVYGLTPEDFREVAGIDCEPSEIIEGISLLRSLRKAIGRESPRIHAKLMMPGAGAKQIAIFQEQYGGIADETSAMDAPHNWGGSLIQIGAAPPTRKVCPMPFYTLAIKANGLVTVCCADWRNALAIGDVKRHSLKQIWQGETVDGATHLKLPPLQRVQELHWQGRRAELHPCRTCTSFFDYPDDLDGHLGV
jgi:MoaA/NifB/PqqE/SkfB family radical SAM enzyme